MQAFLTRLLTVDLPGLIVLPKRLDINIPPAVTAVAEAAVGRDAVMRAVASAVLQVSRATSARILLLPVSMQLHFESLPVINIPPSGSAVAKAGLIGMLSCWQMPLQCFT